MRPLERWGWIFFVAGSAVFTAVGLAEGDFWVTLGGALFVVGCAALLVDAHR